MHSKGFARTPAEKEKEAIVFIKTFIILYNISFKSYKII